MSSKLYKTPELTKYGDIQQLTQAIGVSGNDLIVTGSTTVTVNPNGSVTTDGTVSPSIGSGVGIIP